jgi:hypothetical protein
VFRNRLAEWLRMGGAAARVSERNRRQKPARTIKVPLPFHQDRKE